jgi:tripartite-type tricarboxylate transporter receptor subunit TctC
MKPAKYLLNGLLALSATTAMVAAAQENYPNKPIRMIVPIAAGSVTDVVLRAAGQQLSQTLGQQIIIDNRPGANGVIGAQACAAAPPDGYTICAVYHAIMSFNPYLLDKLPYDPARDFLPVTNLYFVTEALVAPRSLPVSSVEELRKYAVANPGTLNFATLGEGSLQELMIAWLNKEWSTTLVGIPYKGGGPIATAVMSGEIQLAQMGAGNFLGAIQSGQVKPLALSATRRSPLLPQVPTMSEAGLGGFPSRPWWGLVVPRGTPAPIVARLNAEFVRLFRDPKFLEFLDGHFVEPAAGTPDDFAVFLKADRENAAALIRLAGPAKR